MLHSKACMERVARFEAKYPNYCRSCGGWGGFTQFNYPHEPDDFDDCDDCIGSFRCSLCGASIPEDFWDDGDYGNKILPCGHPENPDEGFPFCDCGITPICEEDLVEMKYLHQRINEWDIIGEVWECPNCLKRKEIY